MSGTRKILIVGNGFDLAHFLPTKYEHFIHAMKVVEKSEEGHLIFCELFKDLPENNDFFLCTRQKLIPNSKVAYQGIDK